MNYNFKNLVFEGGGMKGLAYVGALEVLQEKGIYAQIERVAGASAGAIMALLLGLNYSAEDLRGLFWSLCFKDFLDDSWGIVRDGRRLLFDYGWYKGERLRDFVARLIEQHTGTRHCTFAQWEQLRAKKHFRELYIVGSNLSTGFSEIFSAQHTPHLRIADALRISMSIPLFFAAQRNARGDVYVDGGLLDNYPLHLFDQPPFWSAEENGAPPYNPHTLGFRLDAGQRIAAFRHRAAPPRRDIRHFFDYTRALFEALLTQQDNRHLHSDDWQRTIYIDTLGVRTTDFDIDEGTKRGLIESGTRHTRQYFDWYDQPRKTEKTRPTSL